MRLNLLILLLSISFCTANSKNFSQEATVNSFSDDWLVYDKYYQAYIPYIQKIHTNIYSVSKRIQLDNYNGYILKFDAEPGLCLFIDNSIYYKNISKKKESISIDISNIRRINKNKEQVLTFYQSEGKLPLEHAGIIKKGAIEGSKDMGEVAISAIFPRIDSQLSSSYYIIAFLIMVVLFTFYKRVFGKEYDYFISIDLGAGYSSEEARIPSPLGLPMLYILFLGGMGLSLIVMVYHINLIHIFDLSSSFLSKYFLLSFLVFIMLIIRFFYLYMLGWFFNFSKFIVLQYAETVKFFVKITLITATVSVLITLSGYYLPTVSLEQFYYFIILTLIGMAVKVIFLFFRLINFRNLYLFSYICAAEVLPIVIMVKILLF